jgi:hypothetical protein
VGAHPDRANPERGKWGQCGGDGDEYLDRHPGRHADREQVGQRWTGTGGSYSINVACSGTASNYNQTLTVAAGGSVDFTGIVPAVASAPATCTVQEQAPLPTPPTSYVWAAIPTAKTVSIAGGGTGSVNIVNTLTQTISGMTVNVTITGGPASYSASFPISVACTLSSAAVSGITPTSPANIGAGPGTAIGTQVFSNIPQGASCTISQGSLPTAPTGYHWGTPVITQLGSAISSLGPQGQMGGSTRGAAGAASNVASVVNPLIVDAPPPPPPPPATPAPALSGWAQMLAMLLLLGCGVCQVRARHNDG